MRFLVVLSLIFGQFLPSGTIAMTSTEADLELLDETQALGCRYFLEQTLPNGLIRDTSRPSAPASTAATGFGLAALTIIADRYETSRNWSASSDEVQALALQIVRTLDSIQQAQADSPELYGKDGFFYHFIDADGKRRGKCEVSTVDTAILLAGMITASYYFGGEIAQRTDAIAQRIDWSAYLLPARHALWSGAQQYSHGWSPERGVFANTWDRPTDEALLIHLLALAQQPDNHAYQQAFFAYPRVTRQYQGVPVVNSYFGSLFTYFFAHCFYDFRSLGSDSPEQVPGVPSDVPSVNWWDNSIRAAEANRAFCIAHADEYPWYGEDAWGLSACYDPNGKYLGGLGTEPSEAKPFHNGTLPPYGAISCMPFFGERLESNLGFRALRHFHREYREVLWGEYGPRDAIHPSRDPVSVGFDVGIDVGPMVLMIENYRTGAIWQRFMGYPGVLTGAHKVFAGP